MLILALLFAAAEPRSLAVLEFKNKIVNEQLDTGYLTDQVRGAALGAGTPLRVITRENLLTLLAASGKDLAGCEGECEVETGRRIGADLVISGELLKFGSSYKLDMRLHDTKEAALLSAATASGGTVDELDRNLQPAVQKLLAPLSANAQLSANTQPTANLQPQTQPQLQPAPTQPAPAFTRPLSLSITNGESNSSFSISLQHPGGIATCPKPLAENDLCYLSGLTAGEGRITASGTKAFEQSLTIPEGGGKLVIYKASHGALYVGIPMLVVGGLVSALTFSSGTATDASGNPSNAGGFVAFVLSTVVAGSGIVAIIVDLAVSHDYQVLGPMPAAPAL